MELNLKWLHNKSKFYEEIDMYHQKTNRFRQQERTPSYIEFREITRNYNFTEINDGNFVEITEKVKAFTEKYSKDKYSYHLQRDFILGICRCLEAAQLNMKTILPYNELLMVYLDKLKFKVSRTNDLEEKKLIEEAYLIITSIITQKTLPSLSMESLKI